VRRPITLALAVLIVASPWSVAVAQEEPPVDEGVVTEEPSFEPGSEPAVVLEIEAEGGDEKAWTFRYLVPALLAMAVVVLVAVILHYGFRVRGRYRVVR
jgi:hypothetical protein